MPYWVYILRSETTERHYVGHTKDLEDRLRRHNGGRTEANKGRGPWHLVYHEEFSARSEAVARERAIKARKSRGYIEQLCKGQPTG